VTRRRSRAWPADVDYIAFASAVNRRRKLRQSRALDLRSVTVRLTHRPTGLVVTGTVSDGHYSRAEMRRLQTTLEADLLGKLQAKVAMHLRTPRRS
jgi:hypothetical protein